MKSIMGISEFGRKAKMFDIAEELAKVRTSAAPQHTGTGDSDSENDSDDDDNENKEKDKESGDVKIKSKKDNDDDESGDSYDDLSDSDDDDKSNEALANRIPVTCEISMVHGTKTVLAMSCDPSGARLASGSIDSR